MKYTPRKSARLLLEDGTLFEGTAIGRIGTSGGEICFNTGMAGYQELITDPSNYGSIVILTAPHLGNYGVCPHEHESVEPSLGGLVVNSFSETYSRSIADQSLQKFLEDSNVVGIANIDVRELVNHVRSKGTMKAVVSSVITNLDNLKAELNKVPPMAGLELSTTVSTETAYLTSDEHTDLKIAVLDLGVKKSTIDNFVTLGCQCKVFPARTSFKEMQKWHPDGYFISNGPGDPSAMPYAIETIKDILKRDRPLMGACLGHQLIALAMGISTFKMPHGHRGQNYPVKNLITGKCEITSQNHGFDVSLKEIYKSPDIEVTHVNLNDNSVEGFKVRRKRAFSVQFHPESSPGPRDSRYLFDNFISLIKS